MLPSKKTVRNRYLSHFVNPDCKSDLHVNYNPTINQIYSHVKTNGRFIYSYSDLFDPYVKYIFITNPIVLNFHKEFLSNKRSVFTCPLEMPGEMVQGLVPGF